MKRRQLLQFAIGALLSTNMLYGLEIFQGGEKMGFTVKHLVSETDAEPKAGDLINLRDYTFYYDGSEKIELVAGFEFGGDLVTYRILDKKEVPFAVVIDKEEGFDSDDGSVINPLTGMSKSELKHVRSLKVAKWDSQLKNQFATMDFSKCMVQITENSSSIKKLPSINNSVKYLDYERGEKSIDRKLLQSIDQLKYLRCRSNGQAIRELIKRNHSSLVILKTDYLGNHTAPNIFPKLKTLTINYSDLTNLDLLKTIPLLENFRISAPSVKKIPLIKFPTIKQLNILDTLVSVKDIEQLARLNPQCDVIGGRQRMIDQMAKSIVRIEFDDSFRKKVPAITDPAIVKSFLENLQVVDPIDFENLEYVDLCPCCNMVFKLIDKNGGITYLTAGESNIKVSSKKFNLYGPLKPGFFQKISKLYRDQKRLAPKSEKKVNKPKKTPKVKVPKKTNLNKQSFYNQYKEFQTNEIGDVVGNIESYYKKGLVGIRNLAGKTIVTCKYNEIHVASPEHFVGQRNGKWWLLDLKENIIGKGYDTVVSRGFSDTGILLQRGNEVSYVSRTGDVKTLPAIKGFSYDEAASPTTFIVEYRDEQDYKKSREGVVDDKGNWVIKPERQHFTCRGVELLVCRKNKKKDLYDSTGKFLYTSTMILNIEPFNEQGWTQVDSKPVTLLHKSGKVKKLPQYKYVQLYDKFIKFYKFRRRGYLDYNFKEVIAPNSSYRKYLGEGLFEITTDQSKKVPHPNGTENLAESMFDEIVFGYTTNKKIVTLDGKVAFDLPKDCSIGMFKYGIASIHSRENGLTGFINTKGEVITEPFLPISHHTFAPNRLWVRNGRDFIIFDFNGNVVK